MGIIIQNIEYYLPEKEVSNEDLQHWNPQWDINKVGDKSGVISRRIARESETAFDLACHAVEKLLSDPLLKQADIQGIIFCTQSPDYIMPSNSFLIHKHFGFSSETWAFDINLACSGFIYALSIARGMMETGLGKNILLITADTYSKFINPKDRATTVLFGDGAAACIVSKTEGRGIIDIALASSGNEYEAFYVPAGGARQPKSQYTKSVSIDSSGNELTQEDIHMNGFAIWKFVSRTVPLQINQLLAKNNLSVDDIDFFGFHQASKLTLDSLYKSLKIKEEKQFTNLEKVGNTVSSSVPIALKNAELAGKLNRGDLVLLSGFGVGLSWGSLLMRY